MSCVLSMWLLMFRFRLAVSSPISTASTTRMQACEPSAYRPTHVGRFVTVMPFDEALPEGPFLPRFLVAMYLDAMP